MKYIIIAVLVLTVSCTKQKPFSFVQLCDTQLGMGGYQHDLVNFKQAVKQINELDADFVVICGDLVNHANDTSYADFKEIMEEFKIPCYPAPGNHDVGKIPNDTTLSYYRNTIGKDYYEFTNKGYSFIVTNSQLWKADVKRESEKHDNWFKDKLHEQSKKYIAAFVIGHYPLYTDSLDEKEHYFNFPVSKRVEMLELFRQNNVVAYLSGHTHKRVTNNYNNIQLVSAETTSKNFDKRPFGFRLWHVSADTVKHEFVSLIIPQN